MGRKRCHNSIKQSPYRTNAYAEMDYHLNDKSTGRKVGNSRNGHGKKTVKSIIQELSKFQLQETVRVPSNLKLSQNGLHERTTRLENFDNAILSLYAK